jgi:hypothetical protein
MLAIFGSVIRPSAAHRRRVLPRAAIARASCLLVAIAVLFGVAQAGARYFYCEGLGLSATDPCIRGAHRSPCPLASLEREPFDCCQVLTMRSMPEAARRAVPVVPPAGLVAILPPILAADPSSWSGSVLIAREGERGRAPPSSSSQRRAELMVFLT